jgi:hypothetical protein
MRRVQPLPSARAKSNVFVGPAGVETIYIGVHRAERQIRIYDRRQALIDARRATAEHPYSTRFEAQLRNVGVSPRDLATLPDPFSNLQLVDLCARGLPLPRRLLANYASVFGFVCLRPQLAQEDIKSLASELQASPAVLPHPSQVFAARWSRSAGRLLARLRVS